MNPFIPAHAFGNGSIDMEACVIHVQGKVVVNSSCLVIILLNGQSVLVLILNIVESYCVPCFCYCCLIIEKLAFLQAQGFLGMWK